MTNPRRMLAPNAVHRCCMASSAITERRRRDHGELECMRLPIGRTARRQLETSVRNSTSGQDRLFRTPQT